MTMEDEVLTTETRYEWRPTTDAPPEGWVKGAQWFLEDGTLGIVYFRPEAYGRTPYSAKDKVYVNFTRVTQVRQVTAWKDAQE